MKKIVISLLLGSCLASAMVPTTNDFDAPYNTQASHNPLSYKLSANDQLEHYKKIFNNTEDKDESLITLLTYAFDITQNALGNNTQKQEILSYFRVQMENRANKSLTDLYVESIRLAFLIEDSASLFANTLFPSLQLLRDPDEEGETRWMNYTFLKGLLENNLNNTFSGGDIDSDKPMTQLQGIFGKTTTDHLKNTAIIFFDKNVKNPALKVERILDGFFEGYGLVSFSPNGAKGPHNNEVTNSATLFIHDWIHNSIINKQLSSYNFTARQLMEMPESQEQYADVLKPMDCYDDVVNLKDKIIGDFKEIYDFVRAEGSELEKKQLNTFLFKCIHEYLPTLDVYMANILFKSTSDGHGNFSWEKIDYDPSSIDFTKNHVIQYFDCFVNAVMSAKYTQDQAVYFSEFKKPFFGPEEAKKYIMTYTPSSREMTLSQHAIIKDEKSERAQATTDLKTIELSPYDPTNPFLFEKDKALICQTLNIHDFPDGLVFHPEKIWDFSNGDTPFETLTEWEKKSVEPFQGYAFNNSVLLKNLLNR